MDYLPLFLELKDRPCLLVGGGEIAQRKLDLLLRAGADVEIVAPELGEGTQALASAHALTVHPRPFATEDVNGRYLVVAATDDPVVNAAVFEAGNAAHTLVNSVDQPEISSAIFPAVVDRSPVQIAISTGGSSPTLARVVRGWIEARLPAGLGALAGFIRDRRDAVKAALGTVSERQRFWERVIGGPIPEHVYRGDTEKAEAQFQAELAGRDAGFVALIGAGPGDPESSWRPVQGQCHVLHAARRVELRDREQLAQRRRLYDLLHRRWSAGRLGPKQHLRA